MKSAPFPQANIVMGANQPEYNPLHAHRSEGGTVTSFWEFSAEDMADLCIRAQNGERVGVYFSQLTFGGPLQPVMGALAFNPPPDMPVLPPVDIPRPKSTHKEGDPLKVEDISHIRHLSGPIMFAADTKSAPGHMICHSVRFDTQVHEMTPEFDQTKMQVLHPDADPRLVHLADCFTGTQRRALNTMFQINTMLVNILGQVMSKVGHILPGQMRVAATNILKVSATALKTYGQN